MAINKYAGDRFVGLPSDTKPTGVLDGAFFIEWITRKPYIKESGVWISLSGSAGGGGGTTGLFGGDSHPYLFYSGNGTPVSGSKDVIAPILIITCKIN
jgi:hypothetical protein